MKLFAGWLLAVFMTLTQLHAAQLQDPPPVYLNPGDVLDQPIVWQREAGVRAEFRLLEAPENAELEFGEQGATRLRWSPGSELPEETSFLVLARDIDKDTVILRYRLLVRNADDFPVKAHQLSPDSQESGRILPTVESELLPDSAEPAAAQSEAVTPLVVDEIAPPKEPDRLRKPIGDTTVSLSAISSQIVSIGRKVTFHVSASSADNSPPVVTIDRLPDNATFDKNADGSRTFFWQTSSGDEGEHRFRVFAHHPDNRNSVAMQDFTIIVGDPATRKTEPKSFRDSGS